MIVAMIAAVAANGVIGRDGVMPWRLSTDMRRFKQLTMGKPLIMGRKTFESIGKPLPGRRNIVVTRQRAFEAEGVEVASGIDAAIALAGDVDEAIIAGGGEIYAAAIDRADRLYIPEVEAAPEGDAFFPEIDQAVWREVSREGPVRGEKDSASMSFVVYERKKS